MESSLSDEEKRILLRAAREAITATAGNREPPQLDLEILPPPLRAPAASFVTLTREGQLRGCIGTLKADIPLAEDVRLHAIAAASRDYRFPRVRPEEVDEIVIEISILSTPLPLEYSKAEEIPDLLHPGRDGVILSRGTHRATFLPQVWLKVPSAVRFLEMLCEKAFLPSDAWREGNLQIQTYQVDSFHESS